MAEKTRFDTIPPPPPRMRWLRRLDRAKKVRDGVADASEETRATFYRRRRKLLRDTKLFLEREVDVLKELPFYGIEAHTVVRLRRALVKRLVKRYSAKGKKVLGDTLKAELRARPGEAATLRRGYKEALRQLERDTAIYVVEIVAEGHVRETGSSELYSFVDEIYPILMFYETDGEKGVPFAELVDELLGPKRGYMDAYRREGEELL